MGLSLTPRRLGNVLVIDMVGKVTMYEEGLETAYANR